MVALAGPPPQRLATLIAGRITAGWRVLHFGAALLALALSPSTYSKRHRPALARHIVLDTAPNLAWFTLL